MLQQVCPLQTSSGKDADGSFQLTMGDRSLFRESGSFADLHYVALGSGREAFAFGILLRCYLFSCVAGVGAGKVLCLQPSYHKPCWVLTQSSSGEGAALTPCFLLRKMSRTRKWELSCPESAGEPKLPWCGAVLSCMQRESS